MTANKREEGRTKALREAQKRNAWIDNVKRVYGWDQERAEREWAKIFNPVNP
jgi:hypothetical protein